MQADAKREYYNARRLTEYSARVDLLEVVVGQHAIVLIDLVRAHRKGHDTTTLGQRLQRVQDAWVRVLVHRSGPMDIADNEKEYRFQRTVAAMVQKFIDYTRSLALADNGAVVADFDQGCAEFYRFFTHQAKRACDETVKKFRDYVRYLVQLINVVPWNDDSPRALECATSCIITGMNLGSWLDVILN